MSRTWLAACCLAGCLLLAGAAEAESVEPIALEYRVDASCPSEAQFTREVRARSRKLEFSAAPAGRRFVVNASETRGVLTIVEPDGARSERVIEGDHCGEIVSALALAAALAVDPQASTLPASELELPPEPPAAEPKPVEPEPGPPTPPATPPDHPVAPIAPAPAVEPSSPLRAEWAAGLGLSVVNGPSPELLVAAAPNVELGFDIRAWRPAVRLTLLAAQSGLLSPAHELAEFHWLVARLELCPRRFALASSLSLRACAALTAGTLHVSARDAAAVQPKPRTRPWLDVGPTVGLELCPAGGRLCVEASALVSANVTRDEFVLQQPRRRVHLVPPLTTAGLLGASFRFQ